MGISVVGDFCWSTALPLLSIFPITQMPVRPHSKLPKCFDTLTPTYLALIAKFDIVGGKAAPLVGLKTGDSAFSQWKEQVLGAILKWSEGRVGKSDDPLAQEDVVMTLKEPILWHAVGDDVKKLLLMIRQERPAEGKERARDWTIFDFFVYLSKVRSIFLSAQYLV